MKIYNHHRVCVGEYMQLPDVTFLIEFNDNVHYKDIRVDEKELNELLKNRGLLRETELGQLNIFDI